MMSETAIKLSGVSKRFGETIAVEDATLAVAKNEIVGLLGPSGCGKTTLLRLIAGFETPDAGEILIADEWVFGGGRDIGPDRRRGGMVFQDYALFPHLDVRGNVAFGLPRGRERDTRAAGIIRLVGLDGLGGRFPAELSGGQQQRVALARALAPGPNVILFDEPFSNLDSKLRARVRGEVRAILLAARTAAIFVTHDLEEAFSLADRVAVMWGGRILQVGTPQEVYRRPDTREVAAFVGEADFLPGRLEGKTVACELGTLDVGNHEGASPDVDVMVRPESLRLSAEGGVRAVVIRREYHGHDQEVTLRLPSGREVRARLGSFEDFEVDREVGISVSGPSMIFPHRPGS